MFLRFLRSSVFSIAYLLGSMPATYVFCRLPILEFFIVRHAVTKIATTTTALGGVTNQQNIYHIFSSIALAVAGAWVCHGNCWPASKYLPDRPQILRQLSWQQLLIKFLWHGQCSFARLPLSSFISTAN